MTAETDRHPDASAGSVLPETPHELPFDRARVDDLIDRVRRGERIDLLSAVLGAVDWSAFTTPEGDDLSPEGQTDLRRYYRDKWSDVGLLYLAELLSTEFMTEQRARGDIVFSDRLLELGRTDPELWHEIRQFFRRKEMVTALLAAAHDPARREDDSIPNDDDTEDLWE